MKVECCIMLSVSTVLQQSVSGHRGKDKYIYFYISIMACISSEGVGGLVCFSLCDAAHTQCSVFHINADAVQQQMCVM